MPGWLCIDLGLSSVLSGRLLLLTLSSRLPYAQILPLFFQTTLLFLSMATNKCPTGTLVMNVHCSSIIKAHLLFPHGHSTPFHCVETYFFSLLKFSKGFMIMATDMNEWFELLLQLKEVKNTTKFC